MIVQIAAEQDIPAWVQLAAEVEYLFGPMVADPKFHTALRKCIAEQRAFCVRIDDGPPGSDLAGGLMFSMKPPVYKIGWLAVSKSEQRKGIASILLNYALTLARAPAELLVTTFGDENPEGLPAREFYLKFGFRPFRKLDKRGPEGGSREMLRKVIE